MIEKEAVAGGLCRSERVDGAPLDTGGGHFLDLRRQDVLDFLFRFMPREEWNLYDRVSKIRIRGMEIDHPLEANLWQFPIEIQVDYLESRRIPVYLQPKKGLNAAYLHAPLCQDSCHHVII